MRVTDRKLHVVLLLYHTLILVLFPTFYLLLAHIRLRIESYDWPVNDGAATFGGSHIQYVDYDRSSFAKYMETDMPASDMVVGMGDMIERVVNLKGEPVGKRNGESNTTVGAHYGNTGTSFALKFVQSFHQLLIHLTHAAYSHSRCEWQICHVEDAKGSRLVPPVSLQCSLGAKASMGRRNWT